MTRYFRWWHFLFLMSMALTVSGCSHAPAFDVMGSLFPAWLLCIAAGALLAAIAHLGLVRYRINLLFPLLAYPCLAAVFTFAIWLMFF
jgi:YtcA family